MGGKSQKETRKASLLRMARMVTTAAATVGGSRLGMGGVVPVDLRRAAA
jgi:hypothetical protein